MSAPITKKEVREFLKEYETLTRKYNLLVDIMSHTLYIGGSLDAKVHGYDEKETEADYKHLFSDLDRDIESLLNDLNKQD